MALYHLWRTLAGVFVVRPSAEMAAAGDSAAPVAAAHRAKMIMCRALIKIKLRKERVCELRKKAKIGMRRKTAACEHGAERVLMKGASFVSCGDISVRNTQQGMWTRGGAK